MGPEFCSPISRPASWGPYCRRVSADGEFDQESGKQHISRLTKSLYDSPDVVSVRSIAEPWATSPESSTLSARPAAEAGCLRNPRDQSHLPDAGAGLAGKVTQFEVVLRDDPFSIAAAAALDKLDDQLKAEAQDTESPWHGMRSSSSSASRPAPAI